MGSADDTRAFQVEGHAEIRSAGGCRNENRDTEYRLLGVGRRTAASYEALLQKVAAVCELLRRDRCSGAVTW